MKHLLTLLFGLWSLLAVGQGKQRLTIQPKPGKTGTPYQVDVIRDVSKYPLTSDGYNSFTLAVSSRQFSLTVVGNGVVIPAGTDLPLVAPQVSTSRPAWITVDPAYTYDGTTFTLLSSASVAKLIFYNADGSSFSKVNPDNIPIKSGDQYVYGSITPVSGRDRRWQVNYTSVPPLKLVLIRDNGIDTYTLTFQPGTSLSPIALTQGVTGTLSTTTTSPPSTTTTTPPSGTVTSPSGVVTYYHHGFGEGTVNELKTFAPFVPSNNQIGSAGGTEWIDNGILRAGFKLTWGGILNNLYYQGNTGFNIVDDDDDGRQKQTSIYGYPGGFDSAHDFHAWQGGVYRSTGDPLQPSGRPFDTGWNPVQGGSGGIPPDGSSQFSQVDFFERRNVPGFGEVLYIHTLPLQWANPGLFGDTELHHWHWLQGNALRSMVLIDEHRTDNQMSYGGRSQELDCLHLDGTIYHQSAYFGNNPRTGDVRSDKTPSQPDGQNQSMQTSDGAIVAYRDANLAVGYYSQHNTRFTNKQYGYYESSATTSSAAYYNNEVNYDFDSPATVMFADAVYVGSLSGFESWLQNEPEPRPFDFHWAKNRTCGWAAHDTPGKFDSNGTYVFPFGRNDGAPGRYDSPFGTWKGLGTIYLRGIFQNISRIMVSYNKPGDTEGTNTIGLGQYVNVNITPSASVQTIAVPLYQSGAWDNSRPVTRVMIERVLGDSVNPSMSLTPISVTTTQP